MKYWLNCYSPKNVFSHCTIITFIKSWKNKTQVFNTNKLLCYKIFPYIHLI